MHSKLPPKLLKSVTEGRAVLFIGSGVSMNAGLPSAETICVALKEELIPDLKNDIAMSQTAEGLTNNSDLRHVSQIYEDYYDRQALCQKLDEMLAHSERSARKEVLAPLMHLPAIREIITTNYDRLLEDTLDPSDYQVVYRSEDLRQTTSPRRQIIKLHGTRTDCGSLVVTSGDYHKFSINKVALIDLVKTLFRQKTIIAIGYSLHDDNFGQLYEETRGNNSHTNYFVSPTEDLFQQLHWERRGFQHVKLTAQDFLSILLNEYRTATYDDSTANFGRRSPVSNPMFNPFTLYDTEALVEDRPQFLVDTFVSPVGFSTILDHQHTFIEGHRGSGKSMILWRLSIKSWAFDPATDLPMWGFYIKMVPGLFGQFRRRRHDEETYSESDETWLRNFTHYFNLVTIAGILMNLEEAFESNIFERTPSFTQSLNFIALTLLRVKDQVACAKDLRRIVEGLIDVATNDRDSIEHFTTATFVSRALEAIADEVPKLKTKHWHILLDEYDNVYPEQQEVINVILRERHQKVRYKIAVRPMYAHLRAIDGKSLDPTDDFGYVSCDSAIWDKKLKPQFFDFIEELSTQRLTKAGYDISIRNLLPAADEPERYYAGFQDFCYLSSGLIRLYLELCKDAVYEAFPHSTGARVELTPIPVSTQDHVVRVHSAILFKSYRSTRHPNRVVRLLRVWGALFHAISKVTQNQQENRKPLSFEISNFDKLSDLSREVLDDVVKSRLIQLPTLPKQPRNSAKDSPAEKYSFHRLLAAFFQLSLTERYSVPVDADLFNKIWTEPEKVVRDLSKGFRSKGIDQFLGKGLPLFDEL